MDYLDTMRFKLHQGKRIGQVLFIVEGEKTEPNLIYKVFCKIFGYQMNRLYRNGEYREFTGKDDPYSRITVINTEESNIQFIDKDNDFLNHMFEILIESYQLDIDNAAIYYLFDRDHASNTDAVFIREMLSRLDNSRDINPDMTRQGLLLLSYPCIESFVGMNLLTSSFQYCQTHNISNGSELKRALNEDKCLPNQICGETLLNCAMELMKAMECIGLDTSTDTVLNSLDHFRSTNLTIFDWQECCLANTHRYGLLSLMIIALLDLGLIQME